MRPFWLKDKDAAYALRKGESSLKFGASRFPFNVAGRTARFMTALTACSRELAVYAPAACGLPWPAILGALALGAGVAYCWFTYHQSVPPPAPPTRRTITLPSGLSVTVPCVRGDAVPPGFHVAFEVHENFPGAAELLRNGPDRPDRRY